jgi:hypothetical protein
VTKNSPCDLELDHTWGLYYHSTEVFFKEVFTKRLFQPKSSFSKHSKKLSKNYEFNWKNGVLTLIAYTPPPPLIVMI